MSAMDDAVDSAAERVVLRAGAAIDTTPVAVGPWTRLTRQLAYANPYIRVHHDTVLTPAGTQGLYGVVEFRGRAVGVVPLFDDGSVLLVSQYRYTLGQVSLELPEGGAKPGEDMAETAARELEEETGYCARHIEHLLDLHTSNSVTTESGALYVATGLYEGVQQLEPTEDISVHRLALQEAVEMIFRGEITDSLTVMGLLACERRLRLQSPQ